MHIVSNDELENQDSSPRLRPARPEPEELDTRPSYMPKIAWIPALLIVGSIASGVFVYRHREATRADELREQLLATQQTELGQIAETYRGLRAQLEQWVIQAASAEPTRFVDPNFRFADLHDSPGIYLRLRSSDAVDSESIARAALGMEQDAITRCVGISPLSARGIYAQGEFLMPEWRTTVEGESDLLRLRVIDEQLHRHIVADVPVVTSMLAARYFMLTIQQGENRRDSPVDVFVWDIAQNRQVFSSRVQARGVLIPVRIRSIVPEAPVAPRPPGSPSMTSGGAHDCSIASQLKELTGETAVSVQSDVTTLMAPPAAPEVAEPPVPVPSGETEAATAEPEPTPTP